ncbi:uncharacterized protein LOC8274522 isoform X1 [Ricinus communis]|uniref:uncharacterized protein LOC8274522 isoform X1 n=1 Tax=Ricinus communis TaxID=3988 RepID=UPI00201A820B|nr:uncharacterized protein LOC8274522 isoform X1 [Ricinus communis]
MLDGLLKSKYHTKCKSLVKMTKTRLEVLKKKKCSVAKFLKNDMADLLRNGLDYNAYCRAEGLLVEQKMIACYNFTEQFCGCIASNLTTMNKQSRECPEECREAVQSLIYAAARIAEFPELRDLRTLFNERYGNCLECFLNKEFAETLKPTPATKEMKLQLMHDIAAEFNIEWNSKPLEQKLFRPPSALDDQHRHDECLSNTDNAAGYKWKKDKDDDDDDSPPKKIRSELASHGRKNGIDEKYNLPNSSEDEVISVGRRDSTDLDSLHASSSSVGSVSEDEIDNKKPFYYRFIPPPYIRTKGITDESKIEHPSKPNGNVVTEEATRRDDFGKEAKPKPKSVRRRLMKSPQDNTGSIERPLKPPPGREKFLGYGGDGWLGKINPSAVKREGARSGSRFAQADDNGDQRDEEEKMLDGLLMDYCKDKPIPNVRHLALQTSDDRNVKSELALPPGREAEQATPKKATKMHARAASLQPEIASRHVHPKLPDCDDLAARIAALKGR